jgi:hypothetical protein
MHSGYCLRQQDSVPVHSGEDGFQGERCGEDEVKFRFQFADFSPYFEQAEPDGIELCSGEVGVCERLFPQGVQDDICRAVEHEAEAVGHEPVTGGPAALEGDFMILDEVLHPAAATVDGLVEERWSGVFKTGDDEADVVAQCGDFGHNNHPEFPVPRAGLVPNLPGRHGIFHRTARSRGAPLTIPAERAS